MKNPLFDDGKNPKQRQQLYNAELSQPTYGEKMCEFFKISRDLKFPEIFDENKWLKEVDSGKNGPIIAISGAIHGNEKIGIEIIREIQNIKLEVGKLILIGGNPRAYKKNKRFIDYNLNRSFGDPPLAPDKSYEKIRAELIGNILKTCDLLIDIHQSNSDNTFCVCEPNSNSLATSLKEKYVINSMDEGCTDKYMDSLGKQAVCIELGKIGDTKSREKNLQQGLKQVKFILAKNGLINGNYKPAGNEKSEILKVFKVYKVQKKFTLDKNIQAFQILKTGEMIGNDGKTKIICPPEWNNCRILFPRSQETIGQEAFSIARIEN